MKSEGCKVLHTIQELTARISWSTDWTPYDQRRFVRAVRHLEAAYKELEHLDKAGQLDRMLAESEVRAAASRVDPPGV